jgi:UDPglucose--hexose-1-phosphate uridylyltransferase
MPEIRQNMATKEWVIIATERAKRPEAFIQAPKPPPEERPAWDARCPFCPGNEEHDLERLRLPQDGDWRLRVVANRYPALQEDGPRERHYDGVNRWISGVGYHEVVVESRLHNTCPALETLDEVQATLVAFQIRGLAFRSDPRIEQVICFKNHGPTAGASLVHPHAQMLALPIVPYSIRARMEEQLRYCDDHGVCAICQMRRDEEQERTRIVLESNCFTAFVPYAAYSPFHIWIVPRRHRASFLDAAPDEVADLAHVLRTSLRKIYFGLNDPDYNYVIRSSPERDRYAEHLHWYLAVVPRVAHTAGFELGSGMYINTALPEESARFLREVTPPDER